MIVVVSNNTPENMNREQSFMKNSQNKSEKYVNSTTRITKKLQKMSRDWYGRLNEEEEKVKKREYGRT